MRGFRELFTDTLIATGAAIVVFSAGLVILILVAAVPVGNPYIGVFTFIFLPTLVATGGFIFVFGVLLTRRERGEGPPGRGLGQWLRRYSLADFAQPRQRRRLVFFLSAGVVVVVSLSVGGMRTAEFMDSPEFCGKTCHTVMEPEYTVYQESPHARVACVDCHIGEGAPWLVRSKVTGIKQLFAVVFETYPRPIESPVANLRPARETCEVCHWPQRFAGDLLRVFHYYEKDEANTEHTDTKVFRVGGGGPGVASGIHWHISAKIWYLPLDEKRQQIGWVGVEKDGGLVEYIDPKQASEITPERIEKEKRLMDCIDCHNRATHVFRSPEELIDLALAQGKINATLPYIKRMGLEALTPVNPSLQEAFQKVEGIREFYEVSYPHIYNEKREVLERAIASLKEVAHLTTFPYMVTTWKTHPNNIGHMKSPGCFRCHGKLYPTTEPTGKPIDANCTLCHYDLPSR